MKHNSTDFVCSFNGREIFRNEYPEIKVFAHQTIIDRETIKVSNLGELRNKLIGKTVDYFSVELNTIIKYSIYK